VCIFVFSLWASFSFILGSHSPDHSRRMQASIYSTASADVFFVLIVFFNFLFRVVFFPPGSYRIRFDWVHAIILSSYIPLHHPSSSPYPPLPPPHSPSPLSFSVISPFPVVARLSHFTLRYAGSAVTPPRPLPLWSFFSLDSLTPPRPLPPSRSRFPRPYHRVSSPRSVHVRFPSVPCPS